MNLLVLGIYGFCMLFITAYTLVQLNLLRLYRKRRKNKPDLNLSASVSDPDLPVITVQLPLYNERYVVERLIDAVCQIKYPANKMEIQLLDDSTDDSFQLAADRVHFWQNKGVDIQQIKRPDRRGFKAGALAYGLKVARGSLIAIFDADFVPDPDFLLRTLPSFEDPKTGVVQTRWGHLNRNYSMLTQLQAFGLDAHFTIEQEGRAEGHYFANFNGTAGIWRKACITDAGGWQSDTLTEDLDLSYRAQLAGWKIDYISSLISPAELPAEMNSVKSQQYRWNKGAAECAVKHLGHVFHDSKSPFGKKINALFHLLNSGIFISVFLVSVLSVPLLFIKKSSPAMAPLFTMASLFLLSLLVLAAFYWQAYRDSIPPKKRSFFRFARLFPLFLSISMGLSLHNAIAVLEGYFGKKTPFIRTPKYNITQTQGEWRKSVYSFKKVPTVSWFEVLLSFYFLGAVIYGIVIHDFGLLPFHLLLTAGFFSVGYLSFKHARQSI